MTSTVYAPRTATAALKLAESDLGKAEYVDMCQAYVCTRLFGTGAVGDYDHDGANDAEDGFKKARDLGHFVPASAIKHLADIPAGVVCFWQGGSHDYGHTAISAGGGKIITTGIDANPKISKRDLTYITNTWGNGLKFVGYATAVVNAKGEVFTITDKPKVTVKVTAVKAKTRMRVTAKVLNVRDTPSTSGSVLRTKTAGFVFLATGYATAADGTKWWTADGKSFLSGAYLEELPPLATVKAKTSMQNVAGYNKPDQPGVTGFKTHIPAIAKTFIATNPDIALFNELSNLPKPKMLPLMDSELEGRLTRAPYGTDGRQVYSNDATITRIASGVLTAAKSTWYDGDDKQMSWEAYVKDGARALDAVGQLESELGVKADAKRVAQILDFLAQVTAKAAAYKVPHENILVGIDGNSSHLVLQAAIAAGWKSALTGKAGEAYTFHHWDGVATKRYDYLLVPAETSTSGGSVMKSTNADHYRLTVTRNLTKEAA